MAETKGDMYQVVGECAFLTIEGRPRTLLLKGAVFDGSQVPKDELAHNVDEAKLVEKLGGEPSGINADGGLGEAKPADADGDRRQADAKSKLPTDGSAPDGRASQEVWVEYAVANGMSRDEASKASKEDLRKALGNR